MITRAGQLRQRITVQSATRTTDEGGGHTTTWADLASLWANVEALGGSERYAAQAVEGVADYTVTIRYRSDVTRLNRVLFGDRTLAIRAAFDPDSSGRMLVLLCREEDNEEGA